MPDISLTTFVDFVLSSGTPKITKVRDAKRQYADGYSQGKDYYKKLREKIVYIHKKRDSLEKLDDILAGVHPKKLSNYRERINSYRKWAGKKEIIWAGSVRSDWKFGDFKVGVNPELKVSINGDNYLIKLYFNKLKKNRPTSKRRLEVIGYLIRVSLPKVTKQYIPAVLDIPSSKFFTFPET